jgi:hypothetical protein
MNAVQWARGGKVAGLVARAVYVVRSIVHKPAAGAAAQQPINLVIQVLREIPAVWDACAEDTTNLINSGATDFAPPNPSALHLRCQASVQQAIVDYVTREDLS